MSMTRKSFLLLLIVCILSLTMIIAAGCNKTEDAPSGDNNKQEEEVSGTYTISFYYLSTDTTPKFTRKVDKGKKLSVTQIPNPIRDGYRFINWYTDKECTHVFDRTEEIKKDLSLYALWLAPYVISLYLDEYTDEPIKTFKVFKGDLFDTSEITNFRPEADEYEEFLFEGWYIDKNYQNKYIPSSSITNNLSLYAHWISKFTILKYETYSGTVRYDDKKVRIGEKEELPIPSRVGCSFEGWYLDANYSRAISPEDGKYYVTPTGEITVYAQWAINHAHTYAHTATRYLNPTCTENGKEANLCTVCGEIDPDTITIVPALGHDWNEGVWVDGGSYHYIACSRCDEQKNKFAHEWDEGIEITPATCTEEGEMGHTCLLCHGTKTSVIEAKGHSYDQLQIDEDEHWIVCSACHEIMPGSKDKHTKIRDTSKDVTSSSCDHETIEGYYCEVCGQDCSKHTAAKPHTPSTQVYHDETGHWQVCTVCNAVINYQAHSLQKDNSRHEASTCEHHGHDIYTCSCGYEKEVELKFADHIFKTTNSGWAKGTDSDLTDAQRALLEDFDFKVCTVCHHEYQLTEHSLVAIDQQTWKNATCTIEGYQKYRCARCLTTHEKTLPMLAHTHPTDESEITILHAATCTEDGEIQYSCKKCHNTINEIVEAGHKWETKEISIPTCTVDGRVLRECTVCHLEEQEILKASHTFSDYYQTNETHHWYTCSKCGEKTEEEEHHLDKKVYGEYSCEGTITVLYSCDICGYKSSLTQITGPGHDWDDGEQTLAPTCTKQGEITYTCKACGQTRIEYIPMVDHTYNDGSQTIAPTCTEVGTWTYVCTECGHKKYEAIAPLGHDFENEGSITTPPGCETTGIRTHTCNHGCGTTQTEVVAALGHNWDPNEVEVTLEPTCTEKGRRTYTCTRCHANIHEDIPELGHDWDAGTQTLAPTCTTTGNKEHHCSRCDAIDNETIPALGHDYVDTVTPPTCEAQGYTTHHCNRCHEEHRDTYVAALGHDYVAIKVVHPTCKATGYTIYECTRCGHSYNADETPKTSHSYQGHVCIYCGEAKINQYLSTFSEHGNSRSDTITINNEEELILFLDYICANYISTDKYIVFKPSYIATSNVNDKWLNNNLWPVVKQRMTTLDRSFTTASTDNIVDIKCDYSLSDYDSTYCKKLTNYDDGDDPVGTIQDYYFTPSSDRTNDWDSFAYNAYDGTFSCTTSDQLIYALTNCIKPTIVSGSKADRTITQAKIVLRQICNDSMTDEEKVAAIYKWLVANVYWDSAAEANMNTINRASNYAEGAFGMRYKNDGTIIKPTGYICRFVTSMGLSKAFVLMTGLEGIRSIVVSGTKADVAYYWNKVLLDTNDDGLKEWYALDITSALQNYETNYKIMSTEQLMVSDTYVGLTSTNYTDCAASEMYNYYANVEETNLFITTQAQMDTLSAYMTAHNSKTTTYKTITLFVTNTSFVDGYTQVSTKQATINNTSGYIVTIAI